MQSTASGSAMPGRRPRVVRRWSIADPRRPVPQTLAQEHDHPGDAALGAADHALRSANADRVEHLAVNHLLAIEVVDIDELEDRVRDLLVVPAGGHIELALDLVP